MAYHLDPTPKEYFGGEPVLDPFTGAPMIYVGGEPVLRPLHRRSSFRRARPPARACAGRPDAATSRATRSSPSAADRRRGSAASRSSTSSATQVWNNADDAVPPRARPGEGREPRRPRLHAGRPGSSSPTTATPSRSRPPPAADDRVGVTVYDGTRIYNLARPSPRGHDADASRRRGRRHQDRRDRSPSRRSTPPATRSTTTATSSSRPATRSPTPRAT